MIFFLKENSEGNPWKDFSYIGCSSWNHSTLGKWIHDKTSIEDARSGTKNSCHPRNYR